MLQLLHLDRRLSFKNRERMAREIENWDRDGAARDSFEKVWAHTLNFYFRWQVENKEDQLKGLPPFPLVFSFGSPPTHNDIVET